MRTHYPSNDPFNTATSAPTKMKLSTFNDGHTKNYSFVHQIFIDQLRNIFLGKNMWKKYI